MLLRPIPESGTIRTAFQNYPRIQYFISYKYTLHKLSYVTDIHIFIKSAASPSLGMIFNVESHGDLRSCSKRRRHSVMTKLLAASGTTL